MKIAVLGATGNIGKQVVDQALDGHHEVIAYVRDAAVLTPRTGLNVIEGSIDDVAALTSALSDADVVVCAIGPRIAMSAARKTTTFMQTLLPSVLEAVKATNTRLVLVSAFGVGASANKASAVGKLIYSTLTRGLFEDKRLAEQALVASGIEWTVVLPVNLKDAPASGKVVVKDLDQISKVPGLPTLSFADAAAGILSIAVDPGATGTYQVITTAKGWR